MHDAGDRNHRILLRSGRREHPRRRALVRIRPRFPRLARGSFLSRTLYLSLDPLYRTAMRGSAEASLLLNPGDVMSGETVAQVLESRHPDYRPGDTSWCARVAAVCPVERAGRRRLDPGKAPVSTAWGFSGCPDGRLHRTDLPR